MSDITRTTVLEPGQPIVEFKDVTKRYKLYASNRQKLASIFIKGIKIKTKDAVKGVSFSVMPGEAVALVGSNGAGKSTIRGRVSALLELTAGFESEMTGRENIYLRGTTLGLSKEEVDELEDTIIEFADIGEYIDQPVRAYSSGMKARLGFAINANVKPEILIVDEALSVGDSNFKSKCLEKVRQLIADENTTLLLVTHNANTAKDFCSRGIYLESGKILYDGSIEEACAQYEAAVEARKKKKKAKKKKEEAMLKETARQIEEQKQQKADDAAQTVAEEIAEDALKNEV